MPAINLLAQKFGRLTVISQDGFTKQRALRWLCRCDCGKAVSVVSYSLRSGGTRSCGCLRNEVTSARSKRINIKHGACANGSVTPEYISWQNMLQRCYYSKAPNYPRYGAKGITVCDRWRHSFQNFLDDMGRKPTKNHTIDRIDSKSNYEPKNCRWATPKEQKQITGRNV